MRDGDAYKAWLEKTATTLGGCDIFIPNVSAGGGMDSEKNWWKNFEIDVLHTVRGCEALMEHLKKSGQGSVVIISSTNALETFAAPMAYNAMKAALITYSKQLSQFVGRENVRVNSVSPGPDLLRGRCVGDDQGHEPEVLRLDGARDPVRAAWARLRKSRASWYSSRAPRRAS